MTPRGIRKLAAYIFTPVRAFTTAEPPSNSIAVTTTFVARQNTKNTICVAVPHLDIPKTYKKKLVSTLRNRTLNHK